MEILNMKLQKIAKEGKSTKLTITLPENELAAIHRYAKYYEDTYNESVDESEIVRNIIKRFIESDKKFSKPSRINKSASNISSVKKQAA